MGRAAPNDHRRPGTAARPSGRNEAATMAKEAKTNAMRMLERMKISYTSHEYDHDDGAIDGVSVATKLGQDPARVFKTLVTQGASRNYFVFVIPVAAELDLKKAAKSVGEKSVAMIHVADINKVTGYIRGGCSPVGMKKKYPTFLDELCLLCDEIALSAGERGHQMIVPPEPIAAMIDAKIVDLTK